MMRAILFATLLPLAACGNGDAAGIGQSGGVPETGPGTTRSYAVTDFTVVDLRGPDDVDVRVGTAFSVRAEGEAETLAKLKVERVGDTLRIGRQGKGWSWSASKNIRVFVTMPRLTAATLSGSGDLVVDRAEGAQFRAALAGSGNLSIGTLMVDAADLSLAGSGDIAVRGTARALGISIAGSGDVDAAGVTASQAKVSVAGSGNVTAKVNGPATVSLMGSGDVDLGPGARCRTSKMGSGTVRCG